MMMPFAFPHRDRPSRVLFLGAHSDDIEIGCGGTALSLAGSGQPAQVTWVVFSGNERRAAEARVSAARFLAGVPSAQVTIHQFRDGYFPVEADRIKDSFEELKSIGVPDIIFTHTRDDRHQDHRIISDLTWNTFRESLILEYEIPKYDGDLGRPNAFVPLSEAQLARKVDLLIECFGSQRSKSWFSADTFRGLARIRGIEAPFGTGYAEAFVARKVGLAFG